MAVCVVYLENTWHQDTSMEAPPRNLQDLQDLLLTSWGQTPQHTFRGEPACEVSDVLTPTSKNYFARLSKDRCVKRTTFLKMSVRGATPLTVVLPGEQVQVQGVIQTAQSSSVIHSPQVPASQASSQSDSEDSQDSSDSINSSQKAHGNLVRRPSYRKILNDLSSEDGADRRRNDDSVGVSSVTSMSPSTTIYQTSSGQYVTFAANGTLQFAGTDGMQGLPLSVANAGSNQAGTTILQYAQTSDGQQILVPGNQVVVQTASGDMQTYQIRTTSTTTSLPQTVVMTSPLTLSCGTQKTDDPHLKREIRLMKNREAARECRRKKKEYVKCLENRVAVLENQNKTLIEELKSLKDLYCHKTV